MEPSRRLPSVSRTNDSGNRSESPNRRTFPTTEVSTPALDNVAVCSAPVPTLADQLTKAIPANLLKVDGGLIFAGSQAFYFYEDSNSGERHFKCVSATALRLAFSLEAIDSGWIGAGVVRCGTNTKGDWFVKFVPPGRHKLKISGLQGLTPSDFNVDSPALTNTLTNEANAQIEQGFLEVRVPLPSLVFAGCGDKYYVWATTEPTFNPQAFCYYAPLPNLYEDGRVCWGENRVSAVSAKTAEAALWLFLNSGFNGDLTRGKSLAHPEDVRYQLLELHRQNALDYPLADLKPYYLNHGGKRVTVEVMVSHLISERFA